MNDVDNCRACNELMRLILVERGVLKSAPMFAHALHVFRGRFSCMMHIELAGVLSVSEMIRTRSNMSDF
jgi:hypothetical protein